MDLSQVTGSSAQNVQGQHHHHHHKSVSDQVSQMGSAIDSAVQAGTMTADQATSLKKELADVTQTLGQSSTSASTASTSTTGQSGQSNPLSQLSDADRKKVFSELQDVRKQLQAANGQASNSTSGNNAANNLFSEVDTDSSGSISQSEFTQFLANIGANSLGYNANGSSSSQTGGSFSISG
jgi:hypothetical protein